MKSRWVLTFFILLNSCITRRVFCADESKSDGKQASVELSDYEKAGYKRVKGEERNDSDIHAILKQLRIMEKNQEEIAKALNILEETRNALIQQVHDVNDVTSFIAASLIDKNTVPYIPNCNETLSGPSNETDLAGCLKPQISYLYDYLKLPVRLVGSANPWEGRVEVFYRGRFTTVCDHGWDREDAQVVCRSLGYSGGKAFDGPRFSWGHNWGEGVGLIQIYLVNCSGDEDSLLSCDFRNPEQWSCIHGDDAGVQCNQD